MNNHLAKIPPSDITAVNHLRSKSNGISESEKRVALHRLWLAAISFLSMTAAAILLARQLPGYIFAMLAAAMIPHLWLFSLHIVGAPLPASLVRLNIVAIAGSVFSAVRGALLRALGVSQDAGAPKALRRSQSLIKERFHSVSEDAAPIKARRQCCRKGRRTETMLTQ
jgi:hypothetical protein